MVMPTPTPAAMRNCGLARRAKTAGALPFMATRAPGAIFEAMLLISARVRATAAMASGFFCSEAMIAVAEYWRQSASSSIILTFPTRPRSSISSSNVATGRGGGMSPYARSMSISGGDDMLRFRAGGEINAPP